MVNSHFLFDPIIVNFVEIAQLLSFNKNAVSIVNPNTQGTRMFFELTNVNESCDKGMTSEQKKIL